MQITIYPILLWIIAIIIVSLDLVIILGSKNLSSRVFAALTFVTSLWVANQGIILASYSPELINYLIRIQHLFGLIISIGFFFFATIYPHDKKPTKKELIVATCIVALFTYLYLFSNILIINSQYIGGLERWAWQFGPAHIIFDLTFYTLWIIILKKFFISYKSEHGYLKLNVKIMSWALLLGIIFPTIFDIFLPTMGNYDLAFIGPTTEIIWVSIIAYSIIRYRQMNVRVVITEVLAIAMAAIFFINIFIDISYGLWGRIIMFTVFLILAYFLIRGALQETRQREQLNELNRTLESKVALQTLEIRRSLEAEKHARTELEKLNDAKDQFIMITQHHLRTPVNSVLWALEATINGTYGTLSDKLKKVLEDTQASGKRLMRIVDDFLNITAIKIGTNILNTSKISLKPTMDDIVAELNSDITAMNLNVSIPNKADSWPPILVDQSKIRESLFIVMENAVRYNQKSGTIKITTQNSDNSNGSFEITIENTGLGISTEEAQKIGTAPFYRGEYARKAYPIGMGIGLSVVKAIIRAHRGIFAIESRGKNEGAKVTITLPM